MFEISREECFDLAKNLAIHISNFDRKPEIRTHWTHGNLEALRSFAELRFPEIKSYLLRKHHRENDTAEGEYLTFDYAAWLSGKGFLIFAESEFDNHSDKSLQGDFEKLLYVHAPIKVMLCWVGNEEDAISKAEMLSKYARENCTQYSEDEVFLLYFANWGHGDMKEAVFYWQVPNRVVPQGPTTFTFQPLEIP